MKKILVPSDFSPNANRAIDYAVQIAKLSGASVYIIHACELLDTTFKDKLAQKEEYNKSITDRAFGELQLLKRSIEDTEQVLVDTQLCNGPVTDTILLAAKEHEVDLVIMGTLGRSGIKEKMFGSITAGVIGRSEKPVLAIPLEYEWSLPKKFLLAVNQFDEAKDLVSPVFDLAAIFGAEVEIAIFTDEDKAVAVDYLEHAREVDKLEETLHRNYKAAAIHPEHLSGHRFQDTINEYIHDKHVDLLAMITHKRSFVKSLLNRSLTKQMSYHAKVPVLAIPASKKA